VLNLFFLAVQDLINFKFTPVVPVKNNRNDKNKEQTDQQRFFGKFLPVQIQLLENFIFLKQIDLALFFLNIKIELQT
jgi:hypothetical protein